MRMKKRFLQRAIALTVLTTAAFGLTVASANHAVDSGGKIVVSGKEVTVNQTDVDVIGLVATYNGKINVNSTTLTVKDNRGSGFGIFANEGGTIEAYAKNIVTNSIVPITASGASTVKLGFSSYMPIIEYSIDINTETFGVLSTEGSTVELNTHELSITSTGGDCIQASSSGQVTSETLDTWIKGNTCAFNAEGGNIDFSAGVRLIISAQNPIKASGGGTVKLSGLFVDIDANGGNAIYTTGNGSNVTIDNGNIYIDSTNCGIYAENGSRVDLHTDNCIRVNGASAVTALNGSTVTLNSNDQAQIIGNISVQGSSTVTADFNDSYSYWKGHSDVDSTSRLDLAFSSGVTWYNTASDNPSQVSRFTSNGGIINLGSGTQAVIDDLEGTSLTVKTDSIDSSLTIGNKNETTTKITLEGRGSIMNRIEKGESANTVLNDLKGVINAEDLLVGMNINDGAILGQLQVDYIDGGFSNHAYRENHANAGLIDMTTLLLSSWRDGFDDLNSRLGDLRKHRVDNGLWTRYARGETSYRMATNRSSTYQLGYDRQVGDWTIGMAYAYTDGTSSFTVGKGENTHHVFSLYGTKINPSGTYLDIVAKYGNLDYEYTMKQGAGSADYETDAYALSAEVGKRITTSTGAWVEPQLQLTYGTVDSATFLTENNIRVRQDSVDSFVARAGIMAGKPFAKGDIYLRASYLYDFDGEVKGTFSNNHVSADINRDIGGGWWEVGFGTHVNLSPVTHLYLDFEKAFAGEVDTDWKWNAGVRYSF